VQAYTPGVPLAPPRSRAWKQHLARAFLVSVVVSFLGSVVAQTVIWPTRTQEESRIIMDGVAYVAFLAASADFLVRWLLRRRAQKRNERSPREFT
jgi:hypothetical protein